jgi:hypothetical protein
MPTAALSTPVGPQHLATWPVQFGATAAENLARPSISTQSLYNSDLTRAASMLAKFDWAIYGFNSGHMLSTMRDRGFPFNVVLACDPFVHGRALFRKLLDCQIISDSASAMLDHIRSSGITSQLMGYTIHSHRYVSSEPTSRFWEIQYNITKQLWLIRSLSIVVAFVHPDHNCRAVSLSFEKRLRTDRWIISDKTISYPDYGDSTPDSCRLILGVHSNTKPSCTAIEIIPPPSVPS